MSDSQSSDRLFSSESVSEGHPDKICDRVSDAILDAFLHEDPQARCAVETMATTNKLVLAGEVRGPQSLNAERMEAIARRVVRDIGYEQEGFHWQKMDVQVLVHEQSADIAQGVDASADKDEGAGDQGIMFGYACRETPQLLSAPLVYSHAVLRRLAEARQHEVVDFLRPDAKAQFTLRYRGATPLGVEKVVVSTQHSPEVEQARIRDFVRSQVEAVLPEGWSLPADSLLVNPTGKFVIGGPDGDAGLTGRKIIVDTYGGAAPHGGGAFSGKDPTKVDRSAAYACRYLAKNVVAAALAERCTLQVAYAIGVSTPMSFSVDTHGTGRVSDALLTETLQQVMDLTPRGIRTHLGLNKPIYERTAAYGHFGREPEPDGGFSWERTDLVETLTHALG